MLINKKNVNLGKPSILDETIDALLSLPQYKQYSRDEVVSYLDSVSYHESRGKNVKQMGGGPATGYFQIEQNSLPFTIEGLGILSRKSGKPITNLSAKRAMDLTREEQAALTLAHGYRQAIAYKTAMNFKDPKNTWLDTHWVGKRDNTYQRVRAERAASWDRAMQERKGKVDPLPIMNPAYSPEADNTRLVKTVDTGLVKIGATISNPDYGKYLNVIKKK
jgi:hypothetical protein